MAQDNVDVVQGAWDAFGRGDIEAVLDAFAPAAETRVPEALPWGGTYAGPDGFRDFLAKLDESFEQFSATPQKVLGADDNHVVVLAKTKGRTRAGGTVEGLGGLDLPAARRQDRRRGDLRRHSAGYSRRSAESRAAGAPWSALTPPMRSLSVVIVTHDYRAGGARGRCRRSPRSCATATS